MNSINLDDYILKDKTDTNKGYIYLHNLPNTILLFDIISELREKYKDETFVITQDIIIINQNVNKEVNFSNCIFQENINFSGCFFNENSTFSYIKNKQGEVIADAAIFKKEVNFFKANFKEPVNFSGTKFGTETDIDNNSKVWVNFREVKFNENARFHYCSFYYSVTFENTSFNKLVDFYYAEFFRSQQFHLTDFFDRAIFSNTIFKQEIQFIYCRTNSNSHIGFESAIFKRGLDISRSNFNCNLNFWNTTIEEEGEEYVFENIDNIKYKNDFEAHDEAPSVYKQLRETYRIIKDNSYKQNNKIEALEFSKREMLVYEKELKSLSADKILLLANKFSNNYGTNWVKGLLFTMLSGFITYSTILYIEEKVNSIYSVLLICVLFVVIMSKTENIKEILQKVFFVFFCCLYVSILCSCNTPFAINWELFIEHYLKVLNVIDLKPFEKEENSIFNLSGLSYLFLFIGRIFIGYGYYQTIQAFRKFGKS